VNLSDHSSNNSVSTELNNNPCSNTVTSSIRGYIQVNGFGMVLVRLHPKLEADSSSSVNLKVVYSSNGIFYAYIKMNFSMDESYP
jgi:hypothetical protein